MFTASQIQPDLYLWIIASIPLVRERDRETGVGVGCYANKCCPVGEHKPWFDLSSETHCAPSYATATRCHIVVIYWATMTHIQDELRGIIISKIPSVRSTFFFSVYLWIFCTIK